MLSQGRRSPRFLAWMRVAVAALSLLVALGASLPVFAKVFAGPKAHVCHCETGSGHGHCACPICFPDLEPEISVLTEAVKGRCGDDDLGWRTLAQPAVLVGHVLTLPPPGIDLGVPPLPAAQPHPVPPPDPRPPRQLS